jgi:hypothetical protein
MVAAIVSGVCLYLEPIGTAISLYIVFCIYNAMQLVIEILEITSCSLRCYMGA